MTRPELKPLTSVRGLFAWMVVLYHLRLACRGWMEPGVVAVLAKGYLAVDFFFLLSGFVIWLNYGERLAKRGAGVDFLVRRIARVWPLHAAMLAFAAAMALLLLATGRPAPRFPFAVLPLHLAMMQDWGFTDALMWNDPAWSISCEWAAYLLTSLAALLLPRKRQPTVVLMVAALLPLLLLHMLFAHAGATTLGFDISRFGPIRCLTEFSCGAVLSTLWQRWRRDWLVEVTCWLLGGATLLGWWAGMAETLAVPFAFATLLVALAIGAERPRNLLAGRAIHFLGEISYATYLSHFLLFFAFKLAFIRDANDVSPAQAGAYLLLVLGASVALYTLVERPAQRAILRRWTMRGKRGEPQLAPARSG